MESESVWQALHVMNKWQIICPSVAIVVVVIVIVFMHGESQRRHFIGARSSATGSDPSATTNSARLVR